MGRVICMIVFLLLNCVNGLVYASLGHGVSTWQYWVGTLCVCGSYLAGAISYMWRDD